MISVGPGRASAGCGGWQNVKGIGQQHPIHGRQDKAGCPADGAMRLKACLHVVS